MRTTLSNAKDSQFFFQQKNNSVFVIFAFKILTKLTNDVVNFEQPGPGCLIYLKQQYLTYTEINETGLCDLQVRVEQFYVVRFFFVRYICRKGILICKAQKIYFYTLIVSIYMY